MIVGKLPNGALVQITHIADKVRFSDERGWVCICKDFERPHSKQQSVLWLPATTRFEWVREFSFDSIDQ